MSRNQVFAARATIAVLFGLGLGLYQTGSPHVQRLANADEVRLRDLNTIAQALQNQYASSSKLPQALAQLNQNGPAFRLLDPETKTAYEYRSLDERRFELCAVFSTDNSADPQRPQLERVHGVGRQCFTYSE